MLTRAITLDLNSVVLLCFSECVHGQAFVLCLKVPRSSVAVTSPARGLLAFLRHRLALLRVLADLSVSLCSVYSGHQSILIPPSELETNPALWLLAVSQYKVRDTFCSYSVMELCTKGLGSQTESLKVSSPHQPLRAWRAFPGS